MSSPAATTQESLFGVGSLADNLFPTTNRFRLFAEKVWPRLVAARPALKTMHCAGNGRPAALGGFEGKTGFARRLNCVNSPPQ